MDDTCGKCKKKATKDIIKCFGKCKRVFHLKCMEISTPEFQVIDKFKNLMWFCDSCVEAVSERWETKSEYEELKQEVTSEIAELKDMLKHMQNKGNDCDSRNNKSYAKAASEVVLIKPKNVQESKKTIEAVQKHVKPSDLEVGIAGIRSVKDGGILIKCSSKDEVMKIKNVAEKKLGKNYKVNTPELRTPSIKIVDIDRQMDNDELVNSIKKQNLFLNHELLSLKVKVMKKMKTKWMAILECDPESFQKIMAEKSLYIEWSRCRVFEYFNVFRCFKCGGFGHRAEVCENLRCPKCAKLLSEHCDDDCNKETPKCFNCMDTNVTLKMNLNTNHSIYDLNCPVLLKKIEIVRNKTNYTITEQ